VNKILTHWTLAFVTLAALMLWGLKDPFVKETARLKSFDLIQKYDTPTVSEDVVIVEIDEKSIEQNGQWPWKRTILADVIWRLREAGAGIIVLPILFSEEDRLGGVVNTTPEIDGVVRRLPLLMRVGKEVYPSVALEVIRVAVGDPSYQVKASEGGVIALRVPKFKTIKTDQYARIWLRWNKEFPTFSITDDFSSVSGKTVIIGNTAQGISTIIATPNGEQYSHIAMAVSLQTVINGENIVRLDTATFLEYVAAGVLAVIIILLAGFAPYWLVGAVLLTVWSGTAYGAYFYFVKHLQLWDASWIILVTTITGFHAVFNRFVKEFGLKQQIKKQFEHYLDPGMVKKLQKDPSLLKLGGEKRDMTFLFCDIRGFTPISEKYKGNPEGLTKLINRFLTRMTDVIIANGGTIDKFMGDCIMAFWNAPIEDPDHEQHAVQAAIDMQEELSKLNVQLAEEELPTIAIGIGINTGEALVGNMGSDQRFDYSVIGDAVNVAARLESSSKTLGKTVVVGDRTYKAAKYDYNFDYIDSITVKGKSEPVKVYTINNTK
jgi:adenylate cyclase